MGFQIGGESAWRWEVADSDFTQTFVRLRSPSTGEWMAHPDLREKLAEDAREQGTNLTAVVVAILARRYGINCDLSVRETTPSSSPEWLNLRLPKNLRTALELARISNGQRSYQDELRGALCAHYGLRIPARQPRRRRPRATA